MCRTWLIKSSRGFNLVCYAKWKNATLTYAHLKDVIDVAGRFDRYLDQLHEGRTQDQLAEEEGVR